MKVALGSNYRKLWLAAAVSSLGDGIRDTVMPLLAASLTRDPVKVSFVALAGGLPWLLLSLISGAMVDRLDRRHTMWRVDLFRAVAMFALGVAVVAHHASIPVLATVAFAIGTGETLFQNASLAILPSVVGKDQLEVANSRLYGAEVVSRQFVGPPLGSILFATMVTLPFFLDSASFVLSCVLILSMRGSFKAKLAPNADDTSLRTEIAEGWRWLWRHRLLRTLAIMLGIWNLLETAMLAIFVLFALEKLHVSEATYGVLFSFFAIGSLIGSFLARRMSARLGAGTTLVLCLVAGTLSATAIGLTSSAAVVAIVMVINGAGGIIWNIVTISLRQAIIPDHLLGRVSSVYRLFGLGSLPIGALLGGLLAHAFGLRSPFFLSAACLVVMTLIALPVLSNRTIEAAKRGA